MLFFMQLISSEIDRKEL